MIKTSIMFFSNVMYKLLRNIILLVIFLFLALFIWLKVGVKADFVEIGPYKVSGLYIKLDKKLSLSAHDIFIPVNKSAPSLISIDDTFKRLKQMQRLFEYIALHNIAYENNRIDFIYANDFLHINTQEYEIVGRIGRKNRTFQAEVPLLYIKKENITLEGKAAYNYGEDRLYTWGRYEMLGIKGKFTANKIKNKIAFDVQSDTFSDLGPLVKKLPLKESITQWPGRRVLAKRYKLLSLRGGGTIEGISFKPDLDALKGTLRMEDVAINFKDGVDDAKASKVLMAYQNGGLYFTLYDPTYLGRDMKGTSLSILDLTGEKPTTLKLDLHVSSPLDEQMQKILKAYKLNIPVLQKSGGAQTKVALDIALKSGMVDAIVDTQIRDARIQLYKLDLGVQAGRVHYENDKVTISEMELKDSAYNARIIGTVGLKSQKAALKADVDYLELGDEKGKALSLREKILDMTIDYHDAINVKIPALDLSINDTKDQTKIELNDLVLIKPYVQDASMIQDGGNLQLLTKDFKNFTFKGTLYRNSCFFYEGDNVCNTRVNCEGTISADGVDFYAFDKRFHYKKRMSRIWLEKINVDLERLIAYKKDHDTDIKQPTASKENKPLVILGKQSDIRFRNYTLVTDSYDVQIDPNGDIKAMGSAQGDIVKFTKKGAKFIIDALRIQDKVLHPLINFDGLSQGRYSLKLEGDPDKTMMGKIIIEGGVMKDFKAYNNTIALLNTLPALATLEDPGFSVQGYKIKTGLAEYRVVESKKIIFDSIYIKGNSSTIAGKGEIDIETGKIDIKLGIQTARKLGEVVGSIPLLGYILLGENKSVTIGLTITGTLAQPTVQTTAAADVLSLPIQLLKRVLESPSKLFDIEEKEPQSEGNTTKESSDPLEALEML